MKALFELFRRFDARRIFGFIRRLGGMSRPKVKCYDLRSTRALRVEGDGAEIGRRVFIGISIHALRVEGDCEDYAGNFWQAMISIHALRVEGDRLDGMHRAEDMDFYPRPPGGGRRFRLFGVFRGTFHFYPRPPGGGRPLDSIRHLLTPSDFYPRPPGGGRLLPQWYNISVKRFLSTPSGWRATSCSSVVVL